MDNGHENDADALSQPSATPETSTPTEPVVTASDAPVDAVSTSETPAGGAIFSSNDTRIETENLPETVQQTALSTAPAGAITPALRTESTVTEDLKLGNAPKKKKWPLVVAVAVMAGVLLGVGGWVLLRNQKSEGAAYNKVENAFLEYANFVLNGETSTDALDSSCAVDNSCYFLRAMSDKDQSNAFFEKAAMAKEKLDEAINTWLDILVSGKGAPENEADAINIARSMQDLTSLHEFIDVYQAHGMFKKNDIVNYFLANGDVGIQDYIANYYGPIQGDNTYLDDLKDNVSAMSEAVLANIDIYARYDCMTKVMDEACFSTNATEEEKETVARNNQIIADYGIESDVYTGAPLNLIDDIVRINNLLSLYGQTEQK